MQKIPDILGMKMPAAARVLAAAGICYHTELTEYVLPPRRKEAEADKRSEMPFEVAERVVRCTLNEDGSLQLKVCKIKEPKLTEVTE